MSDLLERALREGLHDRIDAIAAPPADLPAVRRSGRSIRRRRRAGRATGALTLAVVAGVAATTVIQGPPRGVTESDFAPVGRLDFTEGLRAYAEPGEEIHLGGRTFEWQQLEHLDTDAAATAYGVMFFADGQAHLLREDGTTVVLEDDVADAATQGEESWAPSPGGAAADARRPWVAYGYRHSTGLLVVVWNLQAEEVVRRFTFACGAGDCEARVEALDDGVLFVRDADGIAVVDARTGGTKRFAGPDTRIADVRGGVVLYDGARPALDGSSGWRLVRGAIDAQLTFDGQHVLSWSSTLEPTRPGGVPLELERGPLAGQDGLAWWTVDTDGSVLVAETDRYPAITVYDCAVPSGSCARLGPLSAEHGDPMFIGNDM